MVRTIDEAVLQGKVAHKMQKNYHLQKAEPREIKCSLE